MIGRLSVVHFVLFSILISTAYHTAAQPTLPDITGSYERGVVTLNWNCQYTGIRAISVLRSADSINNYEVIGYVKNTAKGPQAYTDDHPSAGKDYYKLAIAFKSGLVWRSNHVGIATLSAETKPGARQEDQMPVAKNAGEHVPQAQVERESDKVLSKPFVDTCPKKPLKPQLSVSVGPDSTKPTLPPDKPRPRIILKQDEGLDDNTPIFIRSKYIFTDPATGHVNMFLPDDVAGHHYSVKFYDKQNHLLFDLQRISTPKSIVDKRNFQHKGVYRFVIRKDYTELESGFIIIDP